MVSDSSPPVAKGWLNRSVAGAGITSALGNFCFENTTVILSNPALMLFRSLARSTDTIQTLPRCDRPVWHWRFLAADPRYHTLTYGLNGCGSCGTGPGCSTSGVLVEKY